MERKPQQGSWPITIAALVLIACCIIGYLASQPASTTSSTTAHVATRFPTSTPAPTATLTAAQRINAQIVALISQYGQDIIADDHGNDITITDTWADGVANNQVGFAFAQIEIFHVMETIWTRWHGNFNEVDVIIDGPPLTDLSGTPIPNTFAVAMLFAATEAHFDWPHLLPATAWSMYDTAFSTLAS